MNMLRTAEGIEALARHGVSLLDQTSYKANKFNKVFKVPYIVQPSRVYTILIGSTTGIFVATFGLVYE